MFVPCELPMRLAGLLTAAGTAARMSVPVNAVLPPLRAVQVPPPAGARVHCWSAPSVNCEMRAPSAVDHSHTSRALPLLRLTIARQYRPIEEGQYRCVYRG
jgi:hypothetical protein